MIIDAHVHFWKYSPLRDGWITDEMIVIQRDFLPEDLVPMLVANGVDGCIAVQADQSEAETEFLLNLAAEHSFIKGVVGWVDLCADTIEERLAYYSSFEQLKGMRHIIQSEPDNFMLRDDFRRGISKLKKFGFTYDLLLLPKHLPQAIDLVKHFPDQLFVIDHLSKPAIRTGEMENWKKDINQIAQFPNVHCKLSGMVTEADWKNWKLTDFKPFIEEALYAFGVERVMFGSDWPVCLLAASYQQCVEVAKLNTIQLTDSEKGKLWGSNASNFYSL